MKDLTVSKIERLNVLNNRFAIEKIQKTLDITGMMFDGEYRFTKKMVADFYEVEERTIERYLENFGSELSGNGYVLCKGKRLKDLKLQFAPVINVGSKISSQEFVLLASYNIYATNGVHRLSCGSIKYRQRLASPHNDLFHEW